MAQVQTTAGPIDASELGKTLIHEHFRGRDEAVAHQWPHAYDEDEEWRLCIEQANAVKEHGVTTIVEPTAMLLGREIHLLQRIADETGLNIVPCTGIYTYDHLPHYFQNRDADAMADLFVHDIEQGIQGTDVKAAFIKCAADEPGVTENIEKVHRAAARASMRTGRPIMAHSRPKSNTGPRQVEIFLEEGVAPEKVQIAHTGDTDDLDYIEGLLDKGVYIGLDRYGLPMFLPTDQRNTTTLALLEKGYVERMFISQDFVVALDWFPPEAVEGIIAGGMVDPDWSMTLLFEKVLPTLKEGGMTDEQLDTMLVANPARWLSA
ncbi:MAG: phosphotriesterase-related protein [Thermoleophilaceae bacterium]|jgi:phosphotriesterase-related protein|nr:phosphotriesterase-related protein [Thermoleophilaceae bacterium]